MVVISQMLFSNWNIITCKHSILLYNGIFVTVEQHYKIWCRIYKEKAAATTALGAYRLRERARNSGVAVGFAEDLDQIGMLQVVPYNA